MLPKSVDKIRVENKCLEVAGEPNATGKIEKGGLVSEETIHFLMEFKFLEESFAGQTCMICKLWMCQRFVAKEKRNVFITLVSVQ